MIIIQPQSKNTSITEVASYANFSAGSGGDIGYTQDTEQYYVYNEATAMWLPSDVQPTSLVVDYDGSVVPESDAPAWSKEGTEDASVAGGVLTITDDGGSYAFYTLQDAANFVDSKNIGFLIRAKITAQSASVGGFKFILGIRPSSEDAGAMSIAYGNALSGADNITPITTSSGSRIGSSSPDYSPDNNQFQDYLVTYHKDENIFRFTVLGERNPLYSLSQEAFVTSYISTTECFFGTYSSSLQCTAEIDYIKIFNF